MKRQIQDLVRQLHGVLLQRELPDRIGIYFHGLEPSQWDAFSDCVGFCRDQGYEFVDPQGLFQKGPGRRAFLSFDDNYRGWHQALELFDRLAVSVTFYVNSLPFRDLASEAEISGYFDRLEYRGDRTPLSTTELQEIAGAGHVIACHGHSHRNLAALPSETLEEEIPGSKQRLEEILQKSVEHFSYPFGMRRHFSEDLRRYCLAQGFRTVSNAIPAQQFRQQQPESINRSSWDLDQDLAYNVTNLRIDGRLFEAMTGRSPVA